MKKILFLFIAVSAVTLNVHAQLRTTSMVLNADRNSIQNHLPPVAPPPAFERGRNTSGTARTTDASTGRWYNYGDYLSLINGTTGVGFTAPYLWNDSNSVDLYSDGFGYNKTLSVGMVCDPTTPLWNDVSQYPGFIQVTSSDAYVLDSVFISGYYGRNAARTMPVDTLTIAAVYGGGSGATDLQFVHLDTVGGHEWIYNEYDVDTLHYMRMPYDSVHNRVDTFAGGYTPFIKQIYLTSADTSSTTYQIAVPVSVSIPAGQLPAITVSFKSGDAGFTAGDTVFNNSATSSTIYKYGMFRPLVEYIGNTGAPTYPVPSRDNQTQGEYLFANDVRKTASGHGVYFPHWYLYDGSTGGASEEQFPYFAFHVSCPTCGIVGVDKVVRGINSIAAYPNPVNNQLTVSFQLSDNNTANVCLVNMMGQSVATQTITGQGTQQVLFNTSALSDGIYFYTIQAGMERYTSKMVVAH